VGRHRGGAGTKLYCAPGYASSVLVIDAETEAVRTIECLARLGRLAPARAPYGVGMRGVGYRAPVGQHMAGRQVKRRADKWARQASNAKGAARVGELRETVPSYGLRETSFTQ
jgi:hypothetical protein